MLRLLLLHFLLRPVAVGVADPGEAARGGEALRPGAPEAHVRTGAAAAPPEAHPRETLPPPGAGGGRCGGGAQLPKASAALERGEVS